MWANAQREIGKKMWMYRRADGRTDTPDFSKYIRSSLAMT